MIDGFSRRADGADVDLPRWISPFADWYIERDHHGVDPDALEQAFVAGFEGKPRVPRSAVDQVDEGERGEVRAAFDAGRDAAKGAHRA